MVFHREKLLISQIVLASNFVLFSLLRCSCRPDFFFGVVNMILEAGAMRSICNIIWFFDRCLFSGSFPASTNMFDVTNVRTTDECFRTGCLNSCPRFVSNGEVFRDEHQQSEPELATAKETRQNMISARRCAVRARIYQQPQPKQRHRQHADQAASQASEESGWCCTVCFSSDDTGRRVWQGSRACPRGSSEGLNSPVSGVIFSSIVLTSAPTITVSVKKK